MPEGYIPPEEMFAIFELLALTHSSRARSVPASPGAKRVNTNLPTLTLTPLPRFHLESST